MSVHVDVVLDDSEAARIKAVLAATGEDSSVAAFVAVGAIHYLDREEARIRLSR